MISLNSIAVLIAQDDVADKVSIPWYENIYLLLGIMVAIVVVSIMFGNWFTKRIRMADHGWRVALILGCLGLSTLIIATKWPPKLGVDLKGGVTFIGQVDLPKDTEQDIQVSDIIKQLKLRIDPSGVRDIVLRQLGQDKIEIIIPDVDDTEADRIWKNLIQAGFLEFRIVADGRFGEHNKVIRQAEAMADSANPAQQDVMDTDGTKIGQWVNLGFVVRDGSSQVSGYKVTPSGQQKIRDKKTGKILNWQTDPELIMTGEPKNDGLELDRWGKSKGYDQLQILMAMDSENVDGGLLSSVRKTTDSYARPAVSFSFRPEGASKFGRLTMKNKPKSETEKKRLGIVLDNQLLSAPGLNSPIFSDGVIEGEFTNAEVEDLVAILKGGRLKAALKKQPISKDNVESSLGNEMKNRGILAIGFSFVLVLVFMIVWYRFSGIVACFALLSNLVFILGMMMAIKFPFSLTGLAGLVLTVGMSVDANVLIFERIREELEKAATLRMAIRNGFGRATTTIVDANLTTLITAIILYVIGTEQIKGFAVALILGILMSMFTAIFCSRVVFDIAEKTRFITKLRMTNVIGTTNFDFIGKRYIAMVVSIVIISLGMLFVVQRGADIFAHDLRGGTTARIVFSSTQKAQDVRDKLNAKLLEMKEADPEGVLHVVDVTPVTATDFENGTVYKLDSDFVLPENSEDEESANVLRDLVEDVFKGELALRHVDYELVSNEPATPKAPAKQPDLSAEDLKLSPPSDDKKGTDDKKASEDNKSSAPDLNPPAPADDDKKAEDKKSDDKKEAAAPETENKSEESKVEEDSGDCFQDPSQGDESSESTEQDSDGDEQGSPEEATPSTTTPDSTPDATAPETQVAPTIDRQLYKAVVNLTFEHELTVESVIGEIIDGSIPKGSSDPLISKADVTCDAEGFDGEDTSFKSKEWTVTIMTGDNEMAKRVLDATKQNVDSRSYIPSISGVGGSIASDTQLQALAAIIASLIGIVAYVWIRFQKVFFGLAAVVALIHDVLVVLGAIAISTLFKDIPGIMMQNFKISLPVVAAFLTIIGYSLNDTIVVFDRIREVRGKNPDLTKAMINTSIGQTLSRTLLTSLTTFIVVFILFAGGGDTIHGFAFALVIGVIVGTYSSIFVASPVLLWLMGKEGTLKMDTPKETA